MLAVLADLHVGSTVALCPPEPITWDDGGHYVPSKLQGVLWDHFQRTYVQRVAELRKGARLGLLTVGDLVDGDHHDTPQIVSRDSNVQLTLLKKVFQPLLDLEPELAVVVRGTETHVGKGAATEEAFARWLKSQGVRVPPSPSGMYSHWLFNGTIFGTRINAAHHGRIGARPWTKGSVVGALCAQIMLEATIAGNPIPHLAFRGHLHTHWDTHDNFPTRLIQMPCYQFHSAYGYRVVPELTSSIGGVIVVLEAGKPPIVETHLYRPDPTPPVALA